MSRRRRNRERNKRSKAVARKTPSSNPHAVDRVQERLELVRASFKGPLPPPEMLAQYEDVFPGAAEWIFEQAAAQGNHRRKMEAKLVGRGTFAELVGVYSALLMGILGIVGGIFLIYNDKDAAGYTTMLGTLGTLVAIYLTGRKRKDG